MSAAVLTRWPVAVVLDVLMERNGPDRRVSNATLTAWLNRGLSGYLDRLPPDFRSGLTVTTSHMIQRETLSVPGTVTIAVGVIELRLRSFDMQVRVRANGSGSIVASGGCTVALIDPATGERVDLPLSLREAIIQLEQTAVLYC